MTAKVLIAATNNWFTTARLGMALARSGFAVEAICPPHHPLRKTRAVQRVHTYYSLSPLRSLRHAIAVAAPDLIIPGDDVATQQLYKLHYVEAFRGRHGMSICALIERSLGPAQGFRLAYARSELMDLAKDEGIRVPCTEVVSDRESLNESVNRMGFPVVLKTDGSSGGTGVRIINTSGEAGQAFQKLQSPPSLVRVIKRALIDRDKTSILPWVAQRRAVVNVQTFVSGREATSTIACWNGNVLAALHFEVVEKKYSEGPATVVRWIDNAEMSMAAERIVRRLNLSGIHGFDFMLESSSGNAYLIEMNPRATQVGHLALGNGRDLSAALYGAVTGKAVQPTPKATSNDTIALFPQEWIRDPESKFIRSAHWDVPWEEPELLLACVDRQRGLGTRYSEQRGLNILSAACRVADNCKT